jgi:hypothetical protein
MGGGGGGVDDSVVVLSSAVCKSRVFLSRVGIELLLTGRIGPVGAGDHLVRCVFLQLSGARAQ